MSYRITVKEGPDGHGVIQYSGDAQGLVDHCAEYARSFREGERRMNGMGIGARKVLSIEPVVAMDVAQKRGMDYYKPDLWKEFYGRDYSKFRCVDDKSLFGRRGRSRIIKV